MARRSSSARSDPQPFVLALRGGDGDAQQRMTREDATELRDERVLLQNRPVLEVALRSVHIYRVQDTHSVFREQRLDSASNLAQETSSAM